MLAEQCERKSRCKGPYHLHKDETTLLKGVEKTKTFESISIPHIIKHGALPHGTVQTLLMLKSMI